MGTLRYTTTPPRRYVFQGNVSSRDRSDVETRLIPWLKRTTKKTVYWDRIQFRDPKDYRQAATSLQRNFAGGYYVYRVWFTSRGDAALFRLKWLDR